MNKTIVDGYLTQHKLETILKNESSFIFERSEAPVPDSRMRFDFLLTDKQTNQLIAVEFNGYQHYTVPKVIFNDKRKAKIAKDHKIKLIEIPYWVQLNNETFKYYFKRKPSVEIVQEYPHGFIDKKALLPAAFCSLGSCRFVEEYLKLPKKIRNSVYDSILDKIYHDLMSPEEVLPLDLIVEEEWELFQQAQEDLNKEVI
jgi:hypothetical protein